MKRTPKVQRPLKVYQEFYEMVIVNKVMFLLFIIIMISLTAFLWRELVLFRRDIEEIGEEIKQESQEDDEPEEESQEDDEPEEESQEDDEEHTAY